MWYSQSGCIFETFHHCVDGGGGVGGPFVGLESCVRDYVAAAIYGFPTKPDPHMPAGEI